MSPPRAEPGRPRRGPSRTRSREIVRSGFDRVSTIYRRDDAGADAFGHTPRDHERWLRPFFRSVPAGEEVLDLGGGCGVPDARRLSARFRVTGIDISDGQVERARRLVLNARFLRAGMTAVRFRPETFGGGLCLYAVIHVPLEAQRPLLAKVHRWRRPGGLFLVVTGPEADTGTEENWLGSNAPMYWSHADARTDARWLAETGFEVLRRTRLPEPGAEHALFLARRPATSPAGGPRPFHDLAGAEKSPPANERGTSAFQVRIFRTPTGYLAWVDGLGTVEGRTLAETRRGARRFVLDVLSGAFPDRPPIEPAGAREVLEFVVQVRCQAARRPAPVRGAA